jgi:hypothetical protein
MPAPKIILVLRVILKDVGEWDSVAVVVVATAAFKRSVPGIIVDIVMPNAQ